MKDVDQQGARREAGKAIGWTKWLGMAQVGAGTRDPSCPDCGLGVFGAVKKGWSGVGFGEAAAVQVNWRSAAYLLGRVGLAEGCGVVGQGPSRDGAWGEVGHGVVKTTFCATRFGG